MPTATDNTAENTSGNNKKYLIIIILLAILALVLGFLYFQSTQKVEEKVENISTLEIEKLTLQNDLQDMLIQYDTLNVDNEQLNAEMLAQQEQIKEMLLQIEKHKDDAYIMHKLKKEAATLRDIMKGYLVTIDSLNTMNIGLMAEKETLSIELTEVKSKARELESSNKGLQNIVATGSILNASGLNAIGIKVRNNGKQVEMNRADRTEIIKTCATIDENRITESGKKLLYLRIISPEGVVLDDGNSSDNRFEFNGVSGKYSVKRQIDYNNEAQEVCIFYTVNSELPTGQYIVEVYESGTIIGKTTFDLK